MLFLIRIFSSQSSSVIWRSYGWVYYHSLPVQVCSTVWRRVPSKYGRSRAPNRKEM